MRKTNRKIEESRGPNLPSYMTIGGFRFQAYGRRGCENAEHVRVLDGISYCGRSIPSDCAAEQLSELCGRTNGNTLYRCGVGLRGCNKYVGMSQAEIVALQKNTARRVTPAARPADPIREFREKAEKLRKRGELDSSLPFP